MLIRLQSESIFYSEEQLLGGQANSLHQISVDDNLFAPGECESLALSNY